MFDPHSVRFRGPLVPHVDGFWWELMRQGYSPLSGGNLLRLAGHVSRWLEDSSLGASDLSVERVAEFVTHRRDEGYTQFLTPRALEPLLGYLRGIGVAPQLRPPRIPDTPVNRLLKDYEQYLAQERGLNSSTIRAYADFANRFVAERGSLDWRRLRAAEVTEFVLRDSRQMTVGYCKNTVTSLRSLLRFLHVRGSITCDLSLCVPAVAGWRLAWLPKALESDQVDRLLRSCDSRSAIGRRDGAIVRLLVRLGLRAFEAAGLRLDDIDWRAGEIVVRGKGRREGRLPLPRDVGRALVAYLRHDRPRTDVRQVFLRSRAPYRALSTGGVLGAVRGALRRAGVLAGGAHLLRHTVATEMLRRGASLPEIGWVLRHRHIDTTAIYAKVDHAALRMLAQPWPGGAA
jgi:site-specific recombinase XerD